MKTTPDPPAETSANGERVVLKDILASATRIVIRLDLGGFSLGGAHDNILKVESRVAWSTVITELFKEGYVMVSPEEYGARYGHSPEAVGAMVEEDGSLFILTCASGGMTFLAVSLAEREHREQLGPIPV